MREGRGREGRGGEETDESGGRGGEKRGGREGREVGDKALSYMFGHLRTMRYTYTVKCITKQVRVCALVESARRFTLRCACHIGGPASVPLFP